MNNMLTYLLEVTLASAVLYGGNFLLKRKSTPAFLRMYLLSCLLVATSFPLLHTHFLRVDLQAVVQQNIPKVASPSVDKPSGNPSITAFSEGSTISKNGYSEGTEKSETEASFDWQNLLMKSYFLVSFYFLGQLLISLLSIFNLKRKAQVSHFNGHKIYVIDRANFSGANFFNVVFIGKKHINTPSLNGILAHELTHAKRLHSLDVVLADLFKVVFWLNPIAWFLAKQIRLNTEIDTDRQMIQYYEKAEYAKLLVNLSVKSSVNQLQTSFSAVNVKRRLQAINQQFTNQWKFLTPSLVIIYFSVFWLVACSDPSEEIRYAGATFEGVKTITTRYISHQTDTYDKDDRIVAIAKFSPDQDLEKFEQYTTYPYTSEEAHPRKFWINPDNIQVVMDGLDLSYAENNFLYGNNWPSLYAQKAEQGQHPKFMDKEYLKSFKSHVRYANLKTPEEIITERNYGIVDFVNDNVSEFHEEFKYVNNKVSSYSSYHHQGEYLGHVDNISYKYDDDLLKEMQDHDKTLKFYYDNGQLSKTEFYVGAKMYNYRKYFYNDKGLKIKAEIYNTYAEPEYTITYDYEFY